jgi:nitroreductase
METWEAICARRNVRQYTSEPFSEADLNRIAEADWRAPSAKTARRGTLSSSPTGLNCSNSPRSGRAPLSPQLHTGASK